MSLIPGFLILATFAVFAVLMMTRRMPALIALPSMAVVIAVISGAFYDWSTVAPDAKPESFKNFLEIFVLTEGAARLANLMIYAIFGAILSQVVMRTGIAQRIVSVAAEYAGDRKMLLAALLTVVVALCFTSVTGLGAVIMLGSLVLPILLGAGLSAEFSACLMLFAIALGGIFNPVNFGFYQETLNLDLALVKRYAAVYGTLLGLTTLAFFVIEGRKERSVHAWAVTAAPAPTHVNVPAAALLTPILPIGLILALHWEIVPAFLVGILYGAITVNYRTALQTVTAATLEGLKDISPVLGLFIGIGMALNAMAAEPTKVIMKPMLEGVLPQSPMGFLVFFILLAPLALYRGPLNFYGLGAGVAAILLGANLLPGVAIMAIFFAAGQIQGVCDPTNTSNVWLATFSKSSTERFLRLTLPYVWVFVAVALCWAAFVDGALAR